MYIAMMSSNPKPVEEWEISLTSDDDSSTDEKEDSIESSDEGGQGSQHQRETRRASSASTSLFRRHAGVPRKMKRKCCGEGSEGMYQIVFQKINGTFLPMYYVCCIPIDSWVLPANKLIIFQCELTRRARFRNFVIYSEG
jgi:hypothetical protein